MRGFMPQLSFACLVVLATAFSCHTPSDDVSNVFRYNENAGIPSLDPAFARDLETMWATNQLFDGLVELNDQLEVVPCIAKSWEISPDGKIYRFYLRDSVFFHPSELFGGSGTRTVTAHDVVWSFNRILNPEVASPGQWIFSHVDHSSGTGFIAEDDSTVVITLHQPFQPFLGLLTTQYAGIVPREVVEHYGPDFRNHPTGTGPFRFAFWSEQVALVFYRFDQYWRKDEEGHRLPYLDAVKIDFVKDVSVEFRGLLQGRYDFMSGIHPSCKDELLTASGELSPVYTDQLVFQRAPFIKTDYLGIVVDPEMEGGRIAALRDPRVRRALAAAINIPEMVRYLRNNSVIPAAGFVPPTLWPDSNPATFAGYQPDLAELLLTEAGYPRGKNIPEIPLATTADYADLMEYIQHQWEKIGIRTRVQVMQPAAFREATARCQVPVFRKSWLADYADPENFLSLFVQDYFTPAGPNYTHFNDEKVNQLYHEAIRTTDDSLRIARYRQMERIVMDAMPVIPLYHDQVSHFIRKDVIGFRTNGVNMIDLSTVRKTTTPLR
ncbi:MAG: ABC transporter substrate-binding protein [Flavobacteriales bacterium]